MAALDGAAPIAEERIKVAAARLAEAERRRDVLMRLAVTGDEAAEASFSAVAEEVRTLQAELKKAKAAAAQIAADPGLAARLADVTALSQELEDADAQRRRYLRIRLRTILRSLIDRIECTPDRTLLILEQRLRRNLTRKVPLLLQLLDGVLTMDLDGSEALDFEKVGFPIPEALTAKVGG